MNQISLRVVDADGHVPVVKDVPDLVSNRVVDTLDVELGCERRLHAVDDRELGVALLRLFQQPLRFVEQARVLERSPE